MKWGARPPHTERFGLPDPDPHDDGVLWICGPDGGPLRAELIGSLGEVWVVGWLAPRMRDQAGAEGIRLYWHSSYLERMVLDDHPPVIGALAFLPAGRDISRLVPPVAALKHVASAKARARIEHYLVKDLDRPNFQLVVKPWLHLGGTSRLTPHSFPAYRQAFRKLDQVNSNVGPLMIGEVLESVLPSRESLYSTVGMAAGSAIFQQVVSRGQLIVEFDRERDLQLFERMHDVKVEVLNLIANPMWTKHILPEPQAGHCAELLKLFREGLQHDVEVKLGDSKLLRYRPAILLRKNLLNDESQSTGHWIESAILVINCQAELATRMVDVESVFFRNRLPEFVFMHSQIHGLRSLSAADEEKNWLRLTLHFADIASLDKSRWADERRKLETEVNKLTALLGAVLPKSEVRKMVKEAPE